MSDMRNRQTCSICNLDLILPVVGLVDAHAFEVVGEVICGARVHDPRPVTMGGGGSSVARPLAGGLIDLIELVPAREGIVPSILADLALGLGADSLAAVD